MIKRKRRYREKRPQIFICSTHMGRRVHDFVKGWGTVCKDNSILWDHWRPQRKRDIEKALKRSQKIKRENNIPSILIPMICKTFPELLAKDIISAQPMEDFLNYFIPNDYPSCQH